jgi:hypothetical protein
MRVGLPLLVFEIILVRLVKSAPTVNGTSITSHGILLDVISNPNDRITYVHDRTNVTARGWTPQPDGRGTVDIIWQSVTTITLCCWTALCLNVPPPHWGPWRRFYQKFLMVGLGILGPEFIRQLAMGQWTSARRSVADFRRSGYPQWTMAHAFLADMGGFVLRPPDWADFPLDARQVHYLVTEGYVPYTDAGVDMDVIMDKNKGDGTVRFIAVFQILWFSINCIGRVIQGLAIATLELTTLGFIVCTLGTYCLWAHKPLDEHC